MNKIETIVRLKYPIPIDLNQYYKICNHYPSDVRLVLIKYCHYVSSYNKDFSWDEFCNFMIKKLCEYELNQNE